jgi:hypothetical protein
MLSKVMISILAVFLVAMAGVTTSMAAPAEGNKDNSVSMQNELTDEEKDLLFMREEEKLARDIYINMDKEWGLRVRVFSKIFPSEQRHMDAIEVLLEKYGLPDPVANELVLDEFVNDYLQNLYVDLMIQGSISVDAALHVGAVIEEIDIIDLQLAIMRTNPEHTDIIDTYESLMCGSRNHLRAFVRNINLQGEPYEPLHLDDDEYNAIIIGLMERDCGNSNGAGHKKGPHHG